MSIFPIIFPVETIIFRIKAKRLTVCYWQLRNTMFLQKPSTLLTEIPLSAAWPSWIACAAEQIPSLIPSSLCKIKIHHRHRTGCIFVLGTGSYVAICGCEQQVEVTEPAFQELPKQSQDGWKAADAQLCNAEDLHCFQQLYIQVQPSPVSGLVHVAK